MHTKGYIQLIWNYNYWAHHKLWDSLMRISDDDFIREVNYGIGSLHKQVVHTMWAEALWLRRIKGQERINWTRDDYPTCEAVIERWKLVEQDYQNYLEDINQPELDREIDVYSQAYKQSYTHSIAEILIHVVNHGTDHRAQILRLIGDYVGETFEQDMIYYFRYLQSSE